MTGDYIEMCLRLAAALAVGGLIGIGFYFPAGIATALTLGVLSLFRLLEIKMPSQFYAHP